LREPLELGGRLAVHNRVDRVVDDLLKVRRVRAEVVGAEMDHAFETGGHEWFGPVVADPDKLPDARHTDAGVAEHNSRRLGRVEELRPLTAEGHERGFVTFEQIARFLEEIEVTKEQIQELHVYLDEQGIEVVESDGRLARSEGGSVEANAAAAAEPQPDQRK